MTAFKSGTVIEATVQHRAEPITAIVLANNGDGGLILDVIDGSDDNRPVVCNYDDFTDVKVFDPFAYDLAA